MKTTKTNKLKKIIGATLVLCLALGAGAFAIRASFIDLIDDEVPLRAKVSLDIVDEPIPLRFFSTIEVVPEPELEIIIFDDPMPLRFSMTLDEPQVPLVRAMRFTLSAYFEPDDFEELIIIDEDVPL
ncbi:MAG: hypothetical protein FWD49_00690 [Firmicutes bacterium]|nr:hypothetical protein [Bacillota bacterium]